MKKKKIITALSVFFLIILILMPLVTAVVYECIFAFSLNGPPLVTLDPSHYGLLVEQSDFKTDDDVTLAGYKYSKAGQDTKGVVIISHGMGCNGHGAFLPYIDLFTSNGYLVFAYDATGNAQSPGKTVEGFPQGTIDLDNAIKHVKADAEYSSLPIFLFGHSWGAYACGAVLNLHPDIKGAVLVSAFDSSRDMLRYQSSRFIGFMASVMIGGVSLYESVKFGDTYPKLTVTDGLKESDAKVLIVHSEDDDTVPMSIGYSRFYDEFSGNERFNFILYENRGHSELLYSEESVALLEEIMLECEIYLQESSLDASNENMAKFLNSHEKIYEAYEIDTELASSIIATFDSALN